MLNSAFLIGCSKDEFTSVLNNLTFHEIHNINKLAYLQYIFIIILLEI